MKLFSSVDQDILVNTRNIFHISALLFCLLQQRSILGVKAKESERKLGEQAVDIHQTV